MQKVLANSMDFSANDNGSVTLLTRIDRKFQCNDEAKVLLVLSNYYKKNAKTFLCIPELYLIAAALLTIIL